MLKFMSADFRKKYHNLNAITHARALKDDGTWKLYFGNANLVGFHVGNYPTKKAAYADVALHHPELFCY
jgi:hypothetical protein